MVSSHEDSPRAEYLRRLEARRVVEQHLERRHRTLGTCRLLVAVTAAILAYLAFGPGALSPLWLLLPVVLFVGLVVIHERVFQARNRARRASAFYESALARLENHWAGHGETGERFRDRLHPYSEDLDLFGTGSLFELLSTARTREGEQILADWLRAPASSDVIRARHAAIRELRSRLDLREDLAVFGEEVRATVHTDALAAWGEHAAALGGRPVRIAATVLSVAAVCSLIAWPVWGMRDLALAVVLINGFFFLRFHKRAEHIAAAASDAARDLGLLSEILARLEREQFTAPRLTELRSMLDIEGRPPSFRITRLRRLIAMLESREHVFVRLIDPVVLWTLQWALSVESWRKRSGPAIRRWLAAVGEMEALSALAGYAYEHPADPFPDLAETGPCFEGTALAHPLLPEDRAVRNDVAIGGELRLLVISGSNMSGKSTLLRTIGINTVLAQCGAPVRATRLRVSPLAVGASIRILDSLQEGTSRFYTEITRLKQIVDLTTASAPVLFLLDEFLQGTNSHDRRLGAEATVRGLVARGAIGLLTTHDLALAEIAEGLGPQAINCHFEDRLEDGKLLFDYRLRPGVVRRSNALQLMRSLGLDV
ncbi:MAG: DNA mismatch repair protein MutS [Acidobacteriia bacterium]|nr:DNA mismatch repair protein MutS [Terriglobia bacterium]